MPFYRLVVCAFDLCLWILGTFGIISDIFLCLNSFLEPSRPPRPVLSVQRKCFRKPKVNVRVCWQRSEAVCPRVSDYRSVPAGGALNGVWGPGGGLGLIFCAAFGLWSFLSTAVHDQDRLNGSLLLYSIRFPRGFLLFYLSNSRPFVRLQAGHLSRPTFTRQSYLFLNSTRQIVTIRAFFPHFALLLCSRGRLYVSTSLGTNQNEQILCCICIEVSDAAFAKVSLGKGSARLVVHANSKVSVTCASQWFPASNCYSL